MSANEIETAEAPAAVAPSGRTYYLVDGSGFIFRAFHALPMMTRPSDRTPVNAVYGFTAMLIKLLADLKADHIGVVFDAARENFRNRIYAAYKANRDEPPEELVPQFGLIREAVRAFSLPLIEVEGFEADDLIAAYCRQAKAEGARAVIVSSDKDLMQLVGDGVTMFDPMKNKAIDVDEVIERFGVPPAKVVDVQALAGDSVDNVPGVPGIGVKTAAQLITEYGDLDTLLARADEIRQPKRRESLIAYAEQARISRDLVRLDENAPTPVALDDMDARLPSHGALTDFLRQQGFRSLLARVESGEAIATDGNGASARAEGGEAAPSAPAAARTAEPGPAGEAATLVFDGPTPGPVPAAVLAAVPADYVLVQDRAALEAWVAEAVDKGVLGIDTETDSLNAAQARLVGVSLATAPGRACYVPVGHTAPGGDGALDLGGEGVPAQVALEDLIEVLAPVLADPSVLKVGHNLKYDWQVLANHVGPTETVDDTMMISYVLDGGSHGHGLDELADLHLGHRNIKYAEVAGSGKSMVTFDRVPLDRARDYAAEDADMTLRLWRALKPRLVPERMTTIYETIDRPLAVVVARMEQAGIKVDRARLASMSRDFAERLATLEEEIHKLAGHPFNIGSPKQLADVLFEEMGLQGGKKGKTGTYSTSSDVLEPLAAMGHDIVGKVLDWRQLAKLKSTYADTLPDHINPATGRVHTSYSLAATSTGRFASNDPNLQNIPIRTEEGRKIRRAFIAEDGHRLISVDYSQIELRLVAHIADIAGLKEAFAQGQDIHAATASQVFDVPMDRMTPEIRRQAKAINFGIIYGISAFGLANNLRIPQPDAKAFIDQYFARFPELRDWMGVTRQFAREHGFVTTLYGRKCHVPGIKDPNPARRGFGERQAINAPIQGTAADIIKRAMVRIPSALAAAGLKARMLLQVHDELVFEAPAEEAEATARLVAQVMEGAAPSLSVPLVAEAGIGDNWDEAH